MRRDHWVESLDLYRFEGLKGAGLVRPYQPRIAHHIGGEDCSETTGLAHVFSPAAIRAPDRYSSRWSAFRNRLTFGITLGVMARSRGMTSWASSILPIWA